MVKVPPETEIALRTGLVATRMALANYALACRGLRGMPASRSIGRQLDLSIGRLDAMHDDLEDRAVPGATQDALFVALLVAQAGLSSLTDAIGEMREAYSLLQPHELPPEGWYTPTEPEKEAVSFRESSGKAEESHGSAEPATN